MVLVSVVDYGMKGSTLLEKEDTPERTVQILDDSNEDTHLDGLKLEEQTNEEGHECKVKDHSTEVLQTEATAKKPQEVPQVVKFAADSSVSDDTLLEHNNSEGDDIAAALEDSSSSLTSSLRKVEIVHKRKDNPDLDMEAERRKIRRIVEEKRKLTSSRKGLCTTEL